MAAAVVFDQVWKKFRRGEHHDSLRDLVPSLIKGMLRRRTPRELGSEEFWAVKDVSFEVQPGDALGIIGPNGAGKSTTLKLLTRILRPTRGNFLVRGRVGALIEVAAGFHPDLTGRENIFLQGAIMGMRRADIVRRLDDIIDFAGVSEFVDTPVKRYSSGMNARLGFSIAAHLDPDVLIIDEVLSVGDMSFQDKCVSRMHEFRKQGVTIVFVSHNLQAVAALCPTSLFLNRSTQAYGPTDDTIIKYIKETDLSAAAAGESDVAIESPELRKSDGQAGDAVQPGDELTLTVTYTANTDIRDFELGFLVYRSTDGLLVHGQAFTSATAGIAQLSAGTPARVEYAFKAHLTRGHYYIECHAFHPPTQRYIGRLRPAALFRVEETQV
jgi:lipopolysaccharide transport system ATP-binding protein